MSTTKAAFFGLATCRGSISRRYCSQTLPFSHRTKFNGPCSSLSSLRAFRTVRAVPARDLRSAGGIRRFEAAASSTAQSEDVSDVISKVLPDDRIPATIITGFLGSGKVFVLVKWDSFAYFIDSEVLIIYFCLI